MHDSVSLANNPSWSVGNAKVKDLALPHQVVKTSKDFFNRSRKIPGMQPKNVDVIHFESPKAGFDGLDHRLTTVTSRVRMLIENDTKSVLGSDKICVSFRSSSPTIDSLDPFV